MNDPAPRPDEFSQVIEGPWVDAPASSHLRQFRLTNHAFADDGLPSQLFVVFREKMLKRSDRTVPEAEYVYESADHPHLATVFDRMSTASEPGKLIAPELEGRGIKGRRIR